MTIFFKDPSPTYFAPCSIALLDDDGKLIETLFDIQVKRLTETEARALDKKVKRLRAEKCPDVDAEVLADVVQAWRVQVGEEIKVIPFTRELLAQMDEKHRGFKARCVRGFYESLEADRPAHFAAKN